MDVAVEGGPAGELDRQRRGRPQPRVQDRQRIGRVVGRQVEEDDVVGRVAVGRDLARRERVRDDARDMRRGRDVADGVGRGRLEGGAAGDERRAREDDDERRGRSAEFGAEDRLGPSGFEVVEDEAAGAQPAGQLWREGEREQEQHCPRTDDPAGAAHHESPESIEWGHGSGSPRSVERMAGFVIVPANHVPGGRPVC